MNIVNEQIKEFISTNFNYNQTNLFPLTDKLNKKSYTQ